VLHRDTTSRELLDEGGQAPHLLAENFRDIARANRWFGGTRLSLQALKSLIDASRADFTSRPLRVLDVGSGACDIPSAVVSWGRRRGLQVQAWATDISLDVLGMAVDAFPKRRRVVADGAQLPFHDDAVDVAMCSLFLHHLSEQAAVEVLREMTRVASAGVVVNDLLRSRSGFAGAWIFGHCCTRNRLTRNDAPLSVLRAYSRSELLELFAAAGLEPTSESEHFFRVAFSARPLEAG
jgi:ubiquinone/menaquinone biosynthesis C-methylase UbiE